jgi:hypothetical protein
LDSEGYHLLKKELLKERRVTPISKPAVLEEVVNSLAKTFAQKWQKLEVKNNG